MRLRRVAGFALATVGVAAAVTLAATAETADQVSRTNAVDRTNATVVNVVDGDTVVVVHDAAASGVGGEVVRLLGLDAPERDECRSEAATGYLQSSLVGARVRLDAGQAVHDQYGRLLAGVYVNEELVGAKLAARGLGRPMRVAPDDSFRDQVADAWNVLLSAVTGSCDGQPGLEDQPKAANALLQSAGLGLDWQERQAGQAAWLAYETARTAELRAAADALVPADASVVSTADELLDDPAKAAVADFDDAGTIKKQVTAVKKLHASLIDDATQLRVALENPTALGGTDLADERWTHLPQEERAAVGAQVTALTEQSEQAVKEARSILKQYRKLAAKAKARDEAKKRAAEALAHPVSVGTYNICKTTCGSGKHSWGKRRQRLVREVRSADPDVLAVQEANTARWRGVRQIDDVRRLLRPAGYEIASTDYTCTKGCTRGAHIFYKPDRMSPSSLPNGHMPTAGMTSLATIADKKFGKIQDRAVSWAFLTPRGSTRPTLYVSVHLVTQKTKQGERLRVATARRMDDFTAELVARAGLKDVPIVVAGDFNSHDRRQPNGAQEVMRESGFKDGYSAPVKVNAHLGTVNHTPETEKYDGFPPKPSRYQGTPTRIDYVFSTVAPLRHEVVVRLTESGRFDDRYRASDHNMVLVDLPLR